MTMDILELPDQFGFDKDMDLLRQSARRLLNERSSMDAVRNLDTDELGYDVALWKEMAELGWMGLALPESCGGAELGNLSLAIVLEEMGRRLLPGPFFNTALAGLALVDAGASDRCEAIAAGECIATIALSEPDGSWEPEHVSATADPADGGYALRGVKTHVMWGGSANLLVAPFKVGDDVALFAVDLPRAGVTVEPEVCVDTTRRTARIRLDGARVDASARLDGGLDDPNDDRRETAGNEAIDDCAYAEDISRPGNARRREILKLHTMTLGRNHAVPVPGKKELDAR